MFTTKTAIFPGKTVFIEQAGQYNQDAANNAGLGVVRYGFEGFGGLVLFTNQGLLYQQIKSEKVSRGTERKMSRKGASEEDVERNRRIIEKKIVMKWLGGNPNPEVVSLNKTSSYFTYGRITGKAFGFNTLIYKQLYPGIDLVYFIAPGKPTGFEYRFILHPNADMNKIRLQYGGDVKQLSIDSRGGLVISSGADTIYETAPVCFATEETEITRIATQPVQPKSQKGMFIIANNTVGFSMGKYDKSKTWVIDPFVTAASGFSGQNGQIAKDVDFDYAGNIYISGGGEYLQHQLSKFDASGNLLWTFNGSVVLPLNTWTFGKEYGGWAVEKATGKVYLGQGFNVSGTVVIRLNTAGVYDNYVSTEDFQLRECWKMVWNCAGGNPQILLCGGSTSSNSNFSVLSPPNTNITPVNITNVSGFSQQDIADAVVDPLNNDLYTIFTNKNNPAGVDNKLFRHNFPYSSATIAWQNYTGYTSLAEAGNRPYLHTITASTNDNSINALAINSNYLFFWDGVHLKAFSKATGTAVGTPHTAPLVEKQQGGIYADACGNIFVGYTNGVIKGFSFNGTTFNDAAVPDITITGFGTKPVYDLIYNEGSQLLYACGDSFLASISMAAVCPGNIYNLNVSTDCATLSATGVLSPAPPAGSVVSYSIFDGATLVATNSTGVFNGLNPAINYTMRAFVNQTCSGAQSPAVAFSLAPCIGLSATLVHAICGGNNGSITAFANYGTGPYQFSLDGINFQPGNVFSALLPGNYTLTAKDANGVLRTLAIVLNNITPVITVTPLATPATCSQNNGTLSVTANGGVGPYRFSLNGGAYQLSGSFTALAPGTHNISVRDNNNCIVATQATIAAIPVPVAGVNVTAATCGLNNGVINVSVTGGSTPYQYAINGGAYQTGSQFASLAPGNYTITVKDGTNCVANASAIVNAVTAPATGFSVVPATCSNNDGVITISITGGTPPYSFSINGGGAQPSPIFSNLSTGNYSIVVRDFNNCTANLNITVGLINNIIANAGTDKEICFGEDTTLTASASNAVSYNWQPATGLSNNQVLQPIAAPATTTLYTLTATNGPCIKKDSVLVLVRPLPVPNAGPDTTICFGKSTQLNGSGGASYLWSPSTYLSSTTNQNPAVNGPAATIRYQLMVTDVYGCVSATPDAVTVTVLPPEKLFAGNDTNIVAGQPLALFAADVNNTGFTQFTWLPATGLNNNTIQNPLAILNTSIVYRVQASTIEGCTGTDEVMVNVFKQADIFVPSGFTPNNDGLNDRVFALPVGIKSFSFFRIFNRWGQLVFSTSNYATGWDGKFKGILQPPSTFAWEAQAIDYQGKKINKKGLITLIR
ncbi:MAG: gliding motility-associated C-terminal domain-containing protein [Dinghuibacter sp.]|nr:gliding motility-associated C-terminal domain-containing protein [Dinghuibacter sp.]